MDPVKMTRDFEKVIRVFESCTTYRQFDMAKNYAECFFNKYHAEFDTVSRAHTQKHFTTAMNETIARISK